MKSTQIIAFIHRELKLLLSDKVALFWIVLWPLFWIFIVAYVFAPPGNTSPVKIVVGLVNYDHNPAGDFTAIDLVEAMGNATYGGEKIFTVKSYGSREPLLEDLKRGRVDAGLIIPEGFSANLTQGVARLEVLIGARDPRTASMNYNIVRGFLDEFSRRVSIIRANLTLHYVFEYLGENNTVFQDPSLKRMIEEYILGIAIPVNASFTEVKPEAIATRENILGWYVVGSIGMMFLYSGFTSGAVLILREKEAGSLRRILASPISPFTLATGLILSDIIILSISGFFLLFVGAYGVGARILFNPLNPVHWLVPLLIVGGAVMCEGIGIVLSLPAKTSRGASGLGTILGLTLAFTTGVWLPREILPTSIRVLADYFPPAWVFDAMRKIMVFDTPLRDLLPDLWRIATGLIIVLLVDAIIYKVRLHKYIISF